MQLWTKVDVSQQVSTLHKQNFDLKLELYHRRQRQETLEARLEALEKQVEEQAELQEVNEQLLAELEKRDQAVEEAVGIIVTLEDKVERLLKEREHVKDFDKQNESGYFRPSHDEGPPSSPPEFKEPTPPKNGLPRMPSFLSETTEGTEALRSLYLPPSQYSESLPRLQEEETMSGMDSPRLSVLSKSSFLSVYGEKQLSLDAPEASEDTPKRHRTSSSIEKWVGESPAAKVTPVRPQSQLRKRQFLSINDVLESPLQRLEKLKHTLEKHNDSLASIRPQPEKAVSVQDKRKSRDALRRVFTDQASFEHQQTLPPTPDTISTSTLRHYQYSNNTLAEDHVNQGTFLNSSSSTFSVPKNTQNPHQSSISVRPRSAGETITSRREGHGWDTETQDDITDTCSLSSNASADSARGFSGSKEDITPSFFNFYSESAWPRTTAFDTNPGLPSHRASRYEELRRASISDDPLRSDGTVVPSHRVPNYIPTPQYGTIPIDTSPKPEPPNRRSSLSASTKLRTVAGPAQPESSPASSKDAKKSRLPGLRIFGRSETSPTVSGFQQSAQHTLRPRMGAARAQSYNPYEEEELTRATPPPIKRSRGQPGAGYRPVSAGTGAVRRDSLAFDNPAPNPTQAMKQGHVRRGSVNEGSAEMEEGKNGGRKWFGIGRSNSLRRT